MINRIGESLRKVIGYVYWAIVLLIAIACQQCTHPEAANKQDNNKVLSIIDYKTKPEDQRIYLAMHYWDKFDFSVDSVSTISPDLFVNYIGLLQTIPKNSMSDAIGTLINKGVVNQSSAEALFKLTEHYLYDPNSPYYNENIYEEVLKSVLSSPVGDNLKMRFSNQLVTIRKNKVGTKAADFSYKLISGRRGRLYDIQSTNTIILFYNPDCEACKVLCEEMKASSVLQNLIDQNQLAILALYVDKDLSLWQNYKHNIPANWLNAHDESGEVTTKQLYDLKAIPTLYLLDADKNVLLKDVPLPDIIAGFLH